MTTDFERPPGQYAAAAVLLRALGHPARLRIALELGESEQCVHELVERLGLPQPTVSQHLQVLRAARVVSGRRAGREVRYTLTDHHVAHIAGDALSHAGEPHTSDAHTDGPHDHDHDADADHDHDADHDADHDTHHDIDQHTERTLT
jgi:ArsR family transcriptional regulator, zinc-responsive transcriptional repressor